MKDFLKWIRSIVLAIIDFFHRPFKKYIDTKTFRYLACGGTNALLDAGIFAIALHFFFTGKYVYIGSLRMLSYIAAYVVSFGISFPLGFFLNKYIVFPESNLHGRIQLFRYAVLVAVCLILNYIFLKLFIGVCGFYPTPSKLLTTGVVAIFSYFSQRHFTFKIKEGIPIESVP